MQNVKDDSTFVEKIPNVEVKDKNELTLLHWAAENGKEDHVSILLKRGALLDQAIIRKIISREMSDIVLNLALKESAHQKLDEGVKMLLDRVKKISVSDDALGPILEGDSISNRERIIDYLQKGKTEKEVIEEIKKLIPTSQKLTEIIDYVKSKYAWGTAKFGVMWLIREAVKKKI